MAGEVLGYCSNCGAVISGDHFSGRCEACGVAFEESIKAQLSNVPEIASTARPAASAGPETGISRRYTDAYRAAGAIIAFGAMVKILGLVGGSLIALIALASGSGPFGASLLIPGFLLAAFVAFVFWVAGVFVTALGQLLRASLDTAVNDSPFLDNMQRARIMGI